jgi:hypothetical protein
MRLLTQIIQRTLLGLIGLGTLVVVPINASAMSFNPDLVITGTVALDPNTMVPVNGSQSATYSGISGGAALADNGIGHSDIVLTDLGDGLGIVTDASGSSINPSMTDEAFNVFLNDFVFDLWNTSLTDTFKITFEVDYDQNASITDFNTRSSVDPDDIGSTTITTLDVNSTIAPNLQNNELLSSQQLDSTNIGGVFNPGPFADSGLTLFDLILLPDEKGSVQGKQDFQGFANDGSYFIHQGMFISLKDVMNLTAPPSLVPVPPAILLFGTGLLGLMGYARRKKAKSTALLQ